MKMPGRDNRNLTPGLKKNSPWMQPQQMEAHKLKSSGYVGYKDATNTQRQKTKGGSKSEMTSQLKGTGYYGYRNASDEQSEKTKGGSKSEMNDPRARGRSYSSDPDVGELKGAAAKVARIVTKYKAALKSGYKHSAEGLQAVAPPHMESTVKGLKKHFSKGSASPFKLAWYMHDKKKSKMHAHVVISNKNVDLHEKMPKVKNPAAGV